MKRLLLILTLQLLGLSSSFAAVQLYLTGSTSTCPGTIERYEFSTDNEKTFLYTIKVTDGSIIEYGNQSGKINSKSPSDSVNISPYYGSSNPQTPYVLVKWTNLRGATGTVTFTAGSTRYTYVDYSSVQLKVAVGSRDITDTVPYSPSCDAKQIGFVMPEVGGASSYNWQNNLGWSLTSTFNNNGNTYAYFSSNSSTAKSGQVTVSVINNGCPSTNSTRTFAVTRYTPSTHPVIGPDNIPGGQRDYFIAPDGSNYNWTVPSYWQIVAGQGTNTVQVSVPNINFQGNIEVTYIDVCGQSQSGSKVVTSSQQGGGPYEDPGPVDAKRSDNPEAIISAFPNPVVNELKVTGGQDATIMLYNNNGMLMRKVSINHESVNNSINTMDLPNGTYHMRILGKDKSVVNKQVLIQH